MIPVEMPLLINKGTEKNEFESSAFPEKRNLIEITTT